ncbi:hypothetical protein D3877_29065 [Azospirillum cavernae]|uniref:Uncharacterized protein n=1 Tax=Azospirillum cavernae TaxID=2320860 RepID=A0A418VJX2_9PROT|nr:hypothetical protein [Azospirillum cavernae]RJF76438.1 hypothetical protein D3877_29065 [Azospirillum cavernae]
MQPEQHPALRCPFCGWIHAGIDPASPEAAVTPRICRCSAPAGAMEPAAWDLVPTGATATGIVIAPALSDAELADARNRWVHGQRLLANPLIQRAINDVVSGIVSADPGDGIDLRAIANDRLRVFDARDREVLIEHVLEILNALTAENALAWNVNRNRAQVWAERRQKRRSGDQPLAEESPS